MRVAGARAAGCATIPRSVDDEARRHGHDGDDAPVVELALGLAPGRDARASRSCSTSSICASTSKRLPPSTTRCGQIVLVHERDARLRASRSSRPGRSAARSRAGRRSGSPSSSGERRSTSRSLRRSRAIRFTPSRLSTWSPVVLVARAGRRRGGPRRSATTRSATRSTSSTFCVTKTTAPPRVPQRGRALPQPPALVAGRARRSARRAGARPGRRAARSRGSSRWRLPTERFALGAAVAGQLERREQRLGRGTRVVLALEPREQLEVLAGGEAPVVRRPLRHPADARRPSRRSTVPVARPQRPGEDREQRRLARAVRADEREHLAVPDLELDRLERDVVAEAPADAARREQRRRLRSQRLAAAGAARAAARGAGGGVCLDLDLDRDRAALPSHGSSATRSPKNS